MPSSHHIEIYNQQEDISLKINPLIRLIKEGLKYLKVPSAELNIVFVSSREIKLLNKKFLKRTYVTDVLAFSFQTPLDKRAKHLKGDVFVCPDVALANTKRYSTELSYEIVLYVMHGILHLLGYDDHSKSDVKRMRSKEEDVMNVVKNKVRKII